MWSLFCEKSPPTRKGFNRNDFPSFAYASVLDRARTFEFLRLMHELRQFFADQIAKYFHHQRTIFMTFQILDAPKKFMETSKEPKCWQIILEHGSQTKPLLNMKLLPLFTKPCSAQSSEGPWVPSTDTVQLPHVFLERAPGVCQLTAYCLFILTSMWVPTAECGQFP